jgi:hypothetical protein
MSRNRKLIMLLVGDVFVVREDPVVSKNSNNALKPRGGSGSRPSARAILPTKTIRYAHNGRGVRAIPTTGADTAARTRRTPSAIARSNANATSGDASA